MAPGKKRKQNPQSMLNPEVVKEALTKMTKPTAALPAYAPKAAKVTPNLGTSISPLALQPQPKTILTDKTSSAALAAVLPLNHMTRFASGYTNTPTAIASPWTITTVNFTDTPGVGAELGGGCYFAAVSRDPLNAIMEYVGNPTGLPILYDGWFPTSSTPGSPVNIQKGLYLPPVVGVPYPVNPCMFTDAKIGDALYAHPHGSTMYPRTPRTNALFKFTYMTAGESMVFVFQNISGTNVPMSGGMSVFRWSGQTAVTTTIISFTSANSVTYTPQDSGNYAFVVEFQGTITLTFAFMRMVLASGAAITYGVTVPAGPVSHIGHRPIPGIENRTTMTHIRVNGASIMLTPDSAELAKGGRIVGCQVDSAYIAESFVTNANGGSATDTIINLSGSDTRDFKRGGYAFHKPYSPDSYEMQQPFRFNILYNPQSINGTTSRSLALSDYVSYMEPPDGWVVYAVNTPPTVTGVGSAWPGGIIHVTHAFSVEYKTNDVWLGQETPPTGSNMVMYDETMSLVGRAAQFYDNPFHVRDLIKWYNSASPVASAALPSIIAVLQRMGPQAQLLAQALRLAQQVLPRNL